VDLIIEPILFLWYHIYIWLHACSATVRLLHYGLLRSDFWHGYYDTSVKQLDHCNCQADAHPLPETLSSWKHSKHIHTIRLQPLQYKSTRPRRDLCPSLTHSAMLTPPSSLKEKDYGERLTHLSLRRESKLDTCCDVINVSDPGPWDLHGWSSSYGACSPWKMPIGWTVFSWIGHWPAYHRHVWLRCKFALRRTAYGVTSEILAIEKCMAWKSWMSLQTCIFCSVGVSNKKDGFRPAALYTDECWLVRRENGYEHKMLEYSILSICCSCSVCVPKEKGFRPDTIQQSQVQKGACAWVE